MGRLAVENRDGDVSLRSVIGEEEARLIHARHEELVEAWLDEASFANELSKLHEKYGIDSGDEGYATYRTYLRQQYYQNRRTVGPTVDPLEEGCDCLFCQFHAKKTPAIPRKWKYSRPLRNPPPNSRPNLLQKRKMSRPLSHRLARFAGVNRQRIRSNNRCASNRRFLPSPTVTSMISPRTIGHSPGTISPRTLIPIMPNQKTAPRPPSFASIHLMIRSIADHRPPPASRKKTRNRSVRRWDQQATDHLERPESQSESWPAVLVLTTSS